MFKKSDSSLMRILTNIGWMLFDKVFILLLNLVVTIRIANYYGSFEYGTYQYAVSVVALFDIIIAFVDARVIKKRYISEDANKLVWKATISRVLFSFIAVVIAAIYLAVSDLHGIYNSIFVVLLFNSVILNLRFGMQNRYEYLLESKKVVIVSNIAYIIGSLLQLLAVSFKLNIISIAIIASITSFISVMLLYIQYRKDFGRLYKEVPLKDIKDVVYESLPLAIAASCSVIYARSDSIMVGNYLSMSDVGVYAISVKLVSIVQILLSPIRESVYPELLQTFSINKQDYERKYIQITSILTWIYIIGVGFSFLVLPFAFTILNPEYNKALNIYRLYVIGSFFMYNAGLRAGHYTLINKGRILMYTQIASVVLNIILNITLINMLGLYGAAIATVITQFVSLLLSNLVFGEVGRQVFTWQIKAINPKYMFLRGK